MESDADQSAVPEGMDWFFRYSAAVTGALEFDYGDVQYIPWPFLYAGLAGLNASLLGLNIKALEGEPPLALPTRRPHFIRNLLNHSKWFGSDAQLRTLLDRFDSLQMIQLKGSQLLVEKKLLDLLKGHARTVLEFMTGTLNADLSNVPLRKWLELNHEIFELFFFGDYGDAWREFRSTVNDKLNKPGEERKRTLDYVDKDASYWVTLNILALVGPVNRWEVVSIINKMGVSELSGDENKPGQVLRQLMAASVVESSGENYVYSDEYAAHAKKVQSAALPGLRKIEMACKSWLAGSQGAKADLFAS